MLLSCVCLCVCLQVNHLESTGSALAEDVIQKSEIIKSYYMENKTGGCKVEPRSQFRSVVETGSYVISNSAWCVLWQLTCAGVGGCM